MGVEFQRPVDKKTTRMLPLTINDGCVSEEESLMTASEMFRTACLRQDQTTRLMSRPRLMLPTAHETQLRPTNRYYTRSDVWM